MSRKRMDWSGNIVEVEDRELPTERKSMGVERRICDPFEQHLANMHQGDEDNEDVEGACQFQSLNLFECPNFFPSEEDDDTPDVVECRVCGRYDWKKKQSVGTSRGGDALI